MTYAEALDHLHALGPELPASAGSTASGGARRKFDLVPMRTLCAALGDPQLRFPSVLIAGTNGKGSTAATLASILTAAGYRTGLYTSPHLVRVNERIQLAQATMPSEYGVKSVHGADGLLELSPIPDADFARLYTEVDEAGEALVAGGLLPMTPSFFERLTALAFLYYAGLEVGSGAEIVVLEVGLGGRLDATNVVEPLLSVITDIALDHQEFLGDTIAEIAREKCGILREGGTLITLPQHTEANLAIGVAATALHVHAINAATYLPPALRNVREDDRAEGRLPSDNGLVLPGNRYSLRVEDTLEPGSITVDSPLAGEHQQRNLALAICAATALRNLCDRDFGEDADGAQWKISNAAVEAGIRNTRWPGRLEFIAPNLLLDVAHNPAGAWTLRSAISSLPPEQPRTLIFSCLKDKSLSEMSRILFPLFDSSHDGDPLRARDHVVLAPIANARAARIDDLLTAAHALGVPAHAAPHLTAAMAQARAITPAGGLIVATGSVYLVGEIRQLALEHPDDHA